MSVKQLSAVFESSQADGAAFVVLVVMADWATHGGLCWPSYHQIAKKARVSRVTAVSAVRALIKIGELERVPRGQQPPGYDEEDPLPIRSQWRNVYRLTVLKRQPVVQPVNHLDNDQAVQQVNHPDDGEVVQLLDHRGAEPVITGGQIDSVQVVKSTDPHIRNSPSGEPLVKPPVAPLQGGHPRILRADRKEARRLLDANFGRCTHEPRHDTREECLAEIAAALSERRADAEAAVLSRRLG